MATPPDHADLPLEPGTHRLSAKYIGSEDPEESKHLLEEVNGVAVMDERFLLEGSSTTVNTIPDAEKEVVDMIVYLRDRNGIFYSIEDGHLAQAEELLDMTIQEQGLSPIAREVFAVWLVSDLLEIRLKKNHQPHQVVQKWDELCVLYTDEKLSDIDKSEPVLMVQRDVFFPIQREKTITNEEILCLLYHEAKFNVIEGRYPLHPEDYHTLAGLQALIHLGKYNPREHVQAEYRANLIKFYPDHMFQKEKFLFFTRKDESAKCEEQFMSAHIHLSKQYEQLDVQTQLGKLYREYLDICWSYPFYGSAFFSGQVETPTHKFMKMIKSAPDTKVLVAINTEGVSIIDKEKEILLLYAPFDKLLWEYREAEFDGDDDIMPSLFLQFLVRGEEQEVTKLLQIYSREAKLMNALINTCVMKKKISRKEDGVDFVDAGLFPSRNDASHASKVCNKLDKLCLTTYTKKGA
ncbi:putative FERM domain-containing protein FRMD8P1 isoform X2 [Haliotis asinina]|uniref:putative FERM domain-containing protein FRMD8P1 isoform X2 n=1 Tax=Haliotis asinina TaxID=109174 RepID=UPI00353224E2